MEETAQNNWRELDQVENTRILHNASADQLLPQLQMVVEMKNLEHGGNFMGR
jgi:hypothetical protein